MREIRFRGKGTETGKWVYGDLRVVCAEDGEVAICYPYKHEVSGLHVVVSVMVIPATVGQFTGLHDAKGVEIYEGDVLISAGMKGMVVYERGCFWLERPLYNSNSELFPLYAIDCKIFGVSGNVHDAPELMKK